MSIKKTFISYSQSFYDEEAKIEAEKLIRKLEFSKKLVRFCIESNMVKSFYARDFTDPTQSFRFHVGNEKYSSECCCNVSEKDKASIILFSEPYYPIIMADVENTEALDEYIDMSLNLIGESEDAIENYSKKLTNKKVMVRIKKENKQNFFKIIEGENKIVHCSSVLGEVLEKENDGTRKVIGHFRLSYDEEDSKYIVEKTKKHVFNSSEESYQSIHF